MGRLLSLYIPVSAYLQYTFVVVLLLTIIYLFFKFEKKYAKRWVAGLLINCSLLLGGWCSNAINKTAELPYDIPLSYKGSVLDVYKEDATKQNIEILVTRTDIKKSVYFKSLLYIKKDSLQTPLLPGDQILFKSKLTKIQSVRNPYAFNYGAYLKSKKIFGCFYVDSDQCYKLESGFSVRRYFYLIRNYFENKLLTVGLDNNVSSILIALILGDKTQINNDVKSDFSGAGLMHLISVSGMHVGIIYLIVVFLLGGFKSKINKKVQLVIILSCLWFYAGLTGMSPSVFRATIMFSMFIITKSLSRVNYNIYHALAIAAFIILLLNPEAIINIGFWLSFMAVISIVYFYPRINTMVYFAKPWTKFIWSLFSLSLAAQIGTLPIVIYAFGYFPLWFFISNIIIVPLIPFVFIGGLLLMFCPVNSLVVSFLMSGLNEIVLFVIEVASWINQFPLSKYAGLQLGLFEVGMFYVVIIFIVLYNNKRTYQNVIGVLVSIVLFVTLNSFKSYHQLSKEKLVIHEIKGKSAVSSISINDRYLFEDSKLSDVELERNIMPLWRNHLYTTIDQVDFASKKIIPFYNSNLRGLILNGAVDLSVLDSLYLNVDVIVVTHKVTKNIIEDIFAEFKSAKVIFDSSFSRYESLQIADNHQYDSQRVYFVALNGAIEL
ncbi:ComEC/Rec2 family competence protein [Plebeiibacterium sediminum]|nr:ComEC/Rec2 family competence protein [Plebeiobacterium sediminum]